MPVVSSGDLFEIKSKVKDEMKKKKIIDEKSSNGKRNSKVFFLSLWNDQVSSVLITNWLFAPVEDVIHKYTIEFYRLSGKWELGK